MSEQTAALMKRIAELEARLEQAEAYKPVSVAIQRDCIAKDKTIERLRWAIEIVANPGDVTSPEELACIAKAALEGEG